MAEAPCSSRSQSSDKVRLSFADTQKRKALCMGDFAGAGRLGVATSRCNNGHFVSRVLTSRNPSCPQTYSRLCQCLG